MTRRLSTVFGALAVVTLAAGLAAAAPALTEAQVRAFVQRQERAWNQGALDAYYAGFRSDARFTDQYRTPGGQLVPYGASTLGEARAQSRRFRQTSTSAESGEIVRLALSPDGHSAAVVARVVARIRGPKGPRVTCAERRQELVLSAGRLLSRGQTDTYVRCGR